MKTESSNQNNVSYKFFLSAKITMPMSVISCASHKVCQPHADYAHPKCLWNANPVAVPRLGIVQ